MNIGNLIRVERKAKGETLVEIGDALGISDKSEWATGGLVCEYGVFGVLFVSKNACTGFQRDPIAGFEVKIHAILCG